VFAGNLRCGSELGPLKTVHPPRQLPIDAVSGDKRRYRTRELSG
jgi:hypothetical protein